MIWSKSCVQGVEARQAEVEAAEAIIAERSDEFGRWVASRALVPTIRDLKAQAERIARHETARARRRIAAGEPVDVALDQFAHQLANRDSCTRLLPR